jgi:hypothetical protein
MKFDLAVRNIDGRIRAQAGSSLLVRVVDYVSISCAFTRYFASHLWIQHDSRIGVASTEQLDRWS